MDPRNQYIISNLTTHKVPIYTNYCTYSKTEDKKMDEQTIYLKNVNVESLLRGSNMARKKEFGYKNPFENYFQYLDGSVLNQYNVSGDWVNGGTSTRNNGKIYTKKKY